MATVVKESIGLLHEKIVVSITPEDYNKNFESKLKNYAKTANIPGFRKGMVPAGLVKKMYGAGIFQEEVFKAVEEKLFDFLKTEQLDIFAQPLPLEFDVKQIDMQNPSTISMPFEIGLKPNFEVNPKNISATKYSIDVTNDLVEDEVKRLTTRHGKLLDLEVVENDTNMLNVTFSQTNENGELTEGGIEKNNSVLVKYFEPTVASTLMGKKVGDVINIKLGTAFEDKEQQVIFSDLGLELNDESRNYNFNITITKVGGIEEAQMNEDLFKAAFPNQDINSEEEFRTAIRVEIENAFKPQTNNQLFDQIYKALLEKTPIELPETFLKKWLQVGGEKRKTEEEANEEYPAFADSLKWTIISDKVSKDNDVKVEREDIKAYAKKQIMGYMNLNVLDDSQPWVEDYANRMMNDKKFVEDSFYRIQSEKMFEALAQQVNLAEATISLDEFKQLANAN